MCERMKLRIVVTAKVVGNINTTRVVAVVIEADRDRQLLLMLFSEYFSCFLRINTLLIGTLAVLMTSDSQGWTVDIVVTGAI